MPKMPAGVPGTFINNKIQFGDQLIDHKPRENLRSHFMYEGTEVLKGDISLRTP